MIILRNRYTALLIERKDEVISRRSKIVAIEGDRVMETEMKYEMTDALASPFNVNVPHRFNFKTNYTELEINGSTRYGKFKVMLTNPNWVVTDRSPVVYTIPITIDNVKTSELMIIDVEKSMKKKWLFNMKTTPTYGGYYLNLNHYLSGEGYILQEAKEDSIAKYYINDYSSAIALVVKNPDTIYLDEIHAGFSWSDLSEKIGKSNLAKLVSLLPLSFTINNLIEFIMKYSKNNTYYK